MLPGELYFTISQSGGYEFQRKHHIAESIADALSRRSHAPTDASSIAREKNVTHLAGVVSGAMDNMPLDTVSRSAFKKRTLSIAPARGEHMTPKRRLSPSRSIAGIENDAISRTQERRGYLDRDNLRSLGGDIDAQRDMDAATELFSNKKDGMSATKRAQPYIRLPSLQGDNRDKGAFASEVLSQRSRLSRLSNIAPSSTRARSIVGGNLDIGGILPNATPKHRGIGELTQYQMDQL